MSLKQYLDLLIQHFSSPCLQSYFQKPTSGNIPRLTYFHNTHNIASSIKQLKKFDSKLVDALTECDKLLKDFYKKENMNLGFLPSPYDGDRLCNALCLANISLNLYRHLNYKDLQGSYTMNLLNVLDYASMVPLILASSIQPYTLCAEHKLLKVLGQSSLYHTTDEEARMGASKGDILAYTINQVNKLVLLKRVFGSGGFSLKYLKDIMALRYMSLSPTARKMQMVLNSTHLGLSIYQKRGQALSFRISSKAKEIVRLAKQEKNKIVQRSKQLCKVGKALKNGQAFVDLCLPSSWQDENIILPSDIGELIWALTYAEGSDYTIVQEGEETKFSFFNGRDDDAAKHIHQLKRPSQLTEYVYKACSGLSLIFIGWSIYGYFKGKEPL